MKAWDCDTWRELGVAPAKERDPMGVWERMGHGAESAEDCSRS